MNIFRKNSFVPKQTPGFRIVPFQPVRKDLSRAVKAGEGDMIELSYSHDKPSDASNVMPPVYRTFKLPELEGDGKHIVTASGSVDDAVRLTVDGSTKSSSSGAAHSFYLSIEGLSAGIHSLYVQHTNISDYPDPPGNVSMISGTVGACPPVSIVPKDNVEIRCECECTDDNEGGYPSPTSLYRVNSAEKDTNTGRSSAGCSIKREAGLQYMRWSASFGVFRGMAGIPHGNLEIISYKYTSSLLSVGSLTYRHPVASAVLVPEGGITPNQIFQVFEGGAYTSYICDADGTAAFGVGASSSTTRQTQFVSSMSREDSVVTTLSEASYLRVAKTDGSATFYNLTTGEFEGFITSKNFVLTAQEAEKYLVLLRKENGSIRQIWNLWDGLVDVVSGETGYTISCYLPGQVTGIDETSGLYTITGAPFKIFTISGSVENKTLSVTESDLNMPDGTPPFVTTWIEEQGGWGITLGAGEDAITTSRARTDLEQEGCYRVVTTTSKNGITAGIVAEEYFSHPTGELLLSSTEGYGSSAAQTTVYEYDDAGRIVSVNMPNGGEYCSIYDEKGRITVETSPWAGGKYVSVQTTYQNDGKEYSDEPSKVETYYVDAEGHTKLHRKEEYTYSVSNQIKKTEKRVSSNGSSQLEITEIWQGDAENPYARGRARMTQAVDGVETWYDYEATVQYGALYKLTKETRIDGNPVANQSTRSISYITVDGNVVREEEYILDCTETWCLLDSSDYEFDGQNRWVKRTRNNGRITSRALMCTGDVLRTTDEDGLLTVYSYDSARQLIEIIRGATPTTPETIISYTRDAKGRVTQIRTDIGSMMTTKNVVYDLLGRVVSSADELGRVTTYSYSQDGLITTTTIPSGATLITRYHQDGSILEESGTAQRHLLHEIDTVSDGIRQTTLIPAAGEGGSPSILARFITDGFRQKIRTAQATTDANTFIYDRSTYNIQGQLVKSVRNTGTSSADLAMAPTLYEYDNFGNVTKETWKLENTATLGNSRITTYAYNVEQREDGIYRVTVTTKNNGKGTVYKESTAELISHLSSSIEAKQIITDPRGNDSLEWIEYKQGAERSRKSVIPTSDITAITSLIDGFIVEQTDHEGISFSQTRTYTTEGMIVTKTDRRGNTTTTHTDLTGRPIKVTNAADNVIITVYDPHCDHPTSVTDSLGNTSNYKYDIRSRKIAEWGTGIQPALFTYDDADRMISATTFRAESGDIVTDPSERTDGDITRWLYHDPSGLLLRKTYADSAYEESSYNGLNMKTAFTDARGVTTTYTWNVKKGVYWKIEYSDDTPDVQLTWNHLNMMYRVVDASGTRNITYNEYCEQATDKISFDSSDYLVTEGYDDYGRSTGYTLKKGSGIIHEATQAYGNDGRLSTAGFFHGGVHKTFTYIYLPGTKLLSNLSLPNGIVKELAYEEHRDLITNISYKQETTKLVERGYSYDQLTRPITRSIFRQENTRNDTFSYNPRSELTAATLGTDNYAYCYDNIGNRKTVEEEADEITYAANSLNQYTSITKEAEASFVPTYDASGNQTLLKTSTGIWTVVYNAANRPVSFTSQDGNTIVECGYDYMGRRHMKKVTINGTVTKHERYLYRGYLQIACLDLTQSSKMASWFITWDPSEPVTTRPLAIRKDGTWYCYGNDLAKNITEMFDSTGNIVATYDYLPYGEVAACGATTQPFQWSSEFHDAELALVYYNYRHYNPTDGRWINRDPIGEKGGNNIYAYYGNIYLTDYLGYGKVTQYIDRDNPKSEKTTVWHEDTAKFIGVVRDRPSDPPRYLYEISFTNYEQKYYEVLLVEYVDKSILSCWDITMLSGTIISIVRNDKRGAIACAILGTVTDCFEEKESDKFKVLKVLEKLYEGEKKQTNTSTVLRSYPEKLK